MNRLYRNLIFVALSFIFYLAWENGGDKIYGKIVAAGINKIATQFTKIEKAELRNLEVEDKSLIFCTYNDRATKLNIEYLLPVVLLLAWQISLFADKRLKAFSVIKLLLFNFILLYLLQIFFPLLLYNVSQSKFKSTSLFIGMQVFGFIVFFLILKDSLLIRWRSGEIAKK